METITAADGRTLAYEVVGDPDGTPVFWQHGTGRLAAVQASRRLGDRSGRREAGDRRPARGRRLVTEAAASILDWVADAEVIADAAGLGQFVVAGHSGGGPHAMAIAKELGDRVTKVGLASSIAPFDHGVDRGWSRTRTSSSSSGSHT